MSILERMRRSTDSATTRIIIGVVAMVFIFWGAGTGSNNRSEAALLATVGGTRITTSQLYREMRVRNLGLQGTSEEESKRIQDALLEQMIQEELLLQEADALGLTVSSEEITRIVVYEESFEQDGKHSRELYLRALKRMGLTEDKHRDMIRRSLLIQKLQDVVIWGAHVTDAEIARAYELQNTTAEVRWVQIPESALLDDVAVQDSEIDAFLANNELKVKERYDADYERLYKLPRKAAYSAILLRNDIAGADAATLRAKMEEIAGLAAATDDAGFAALARQYSEDLTAVNGGDMGLAEEALIDPPLATVIFAAGAGKVTTIAETGRGLWVARVRSVEEARDLSFDEVKRDVARQLVAQQSVGKLTQEFAEKVLAGWKASGEAPSDLLTAQGLSADTTGAQPLGGLTIPGVAENAGLKQAVMALRGTGVLPGVYPAPGGWVVAAVAAWTPADPTGLASQKDMLRMTVLAQSRNAYLQAWLEDLKKRVKVERAQSGGSAS